MRRQKTQRRADGPARPEKLSAANHHVNSVSKIRPYCAFCNLFGGAIHERWHHALPIAPH
jgi:hypothetical protein